MFPVTTVYLPWSDKVYIMDKYTHLYSEDALRMRPAYFPTTTSSSPTLDSSVPQAPPWFIISRK